MADYPDPNSPYWFTLYEVQERWGFLRVRELARKGHIEARCCGHSVMGVGGSPPWMNYDYIPLTWWAKVDACYPDANLVRFLRHSPHDILVDAKEVAFHVLPRVQRLLDEEREAELDQKPAPVPPVPAPPVQPPNSPKKDKLDGLAVTKQVLAYMDSEHVHQAEALRAVSKKLGAPFRNVERRFHVHEERARDELKRDAAQSAKPKPKH